MVVWYGGSLPQYLYVGTQYTVHGIVVVWYGGSLPQYLYAGTQRTVHGIVSMVWW